MTEASNTVTHSANEGLEFTQMGVHLYHAPSTDKYYFEDEGGLTVGPYDSLDLARAALESYMENELGVNIKGAINNIRAAMQEAGVSGPQLEAMMQADSGGAQEVLQMFAMMNAPKFTQAERDEQIKNAIPVLIAAMDEGRQQFIEDFPSNTEAVRFWAAGYLSAKYKEEMATTLMKQTMGVTTYEQALEVIENELLSMFFKPVPDTNPVVYALISRKGTLEEDVKFAISQHWKRYGNWKLQNSEAPESQPKGGPKCVEMSKLMGMEIITMFGDAVGAEHMEEGLVLLMHHVQADYIADAASAGPMELQAFLTMTNLGAAIEDSDEALGWLSTLIQQVCIDVEDPDLPVNEQTWMWNEHLAAEMKECFQKELGNVLLELSINPVDHQLIKH